MYMGRLFILVHYYSEEKKGRGGFLWALCGHVNDTYPSCSISWFLAPVGDQAFNISFCCIFHSDAVVGGSFRFFGDEHDCWHPFVPEEICLVVSCNVDWVYS